MALLREKDMEISELRIQLDDKDRMLAALRSAARQRDIAQMTTEIPVAEKRPGHQSSGSNTSSLASAPAMSPTRPVDLLAAPKGPEKEKDKKRKSVDEMSRMLDEMIQDRVENGHLIKSSRGSMRIVSGIVGQRESSQGIVPALNAASPGQRASVSEIPEDIEASL
jgi:centromeric protein E